MEKQSNIRMITLNDLWYIFISKLWVIILAIIVVVGGYFTYEKVTFEPRYESTATLYILKQNSKEINSDALADFSLALNVVNDCDYLLKSHAVLDEVTDNLKLDIPYEDLRDSITTSNPDSTRILEVRVESSSPELSKKIVDNVCEIGAKRIKEAMGFQQVNLFEYGIRNTLPVNTGSLSTYIMLSIVILVLIYTIFLLIYLFDDRITSDEDVQKFLNLRVIGNIPNSNEHINYKQKYYRYESRHAADSNKESEEG